MGGMGEKPFFEYKSDDGLLDDFFLLPSLVVRSFSFIMIAWFQQREGQKEKIESGKDHLSTLKTPTLLINRLVNRFLAKRLSD